MLARHFLIGVIALTTLPVSQEQLVVHPLVPVSPPALVLLRASALSDDVSFLGAVAYSKETDRPAFIEVSLIGQHGKADAKRLPSLTIQTWLLRVDGTAVAAMPKSFHDRPMTGDIDPDVVFFDFVPVPPQELAGVVVSVNGKLYVREIGSSVPAILHAIRALLDQPDRPFTTFILGERLPPALKEQLLASPDVVEAQKLSQSIRTYFRVDSFEVNWNSATVTVRVLPEPVSRPGVPPAGCGETLTFTVDQSNGKWTVGKVTDLVC